MNKEKETERKDERRKTEEMMMYEMNKTIEDGLRKMLIEHGREVTRMRYVEGIKIELKGGIKDLNTF